MAALLRFGRGIDRQIVGNFMGKGSAFNSDTMAAFCRSFPFRSLSLDTAFRAFADTFKQPPESQQVVRFTKSFVSAFLEAHHGDYRCVFCRVLANSTSFGTGTATLVVTAHYELACNVRMRSQDTNAHFIRGI